MVRDQASLWCDARVFAGGGLFGGGTSTFGASTPSLFGANSSPSLFGANSSPSLFGGNTFGTQQPTQALGLFQSTPAMGQPQVAPPSVSAAPYGYVTTHKLTIRLVHRRHHTVVSCL